MTEKFELVLFSTDPVFIRQAVAAGVDSIIVDWEYLGKEQRQAGFIGGASGIGPTPLKIHWGRI